jgi:hypothetical protein
MTAVEPRPRPERVVDPKPTRRTRVGGVPGWPPRDVARPEDARAHQPRDTGELADGGWALQERIGDVELRPLEARRQTRLAFSCEQGAVSELREVGLERIGRSAARA